MIGPLALLAAAAPPVLLSPPQSPTELFKAACMGGSVSLPPGTVSPLAYADIPQRGRAALGMTTFSAAEPAAPGAPAAAEVPGQIFEVGPGKKLFLVAPAGADRSGRFARTCAVIWKGEHFAAARDAITPGQPVKLPTGSDPNSNPLGLASFGINWGGLHLSVTTLRDWTVLKADPDADPPKSGER